MVAEGRENELDLFFVSRGFSSYMCCFAGVKWNNTYVGLIDVREIGNFVILSNNLLFENAH